MKGEIIKSKGPLVVLVVLLIAAYLFNPSYYYADNPGVLGDNYYHMHNMLEEGLYVKHQHMAFPLVADIFIQALISTGLLDPADPYFLEKCFRLAVLPVGAINVIALALLFVFLNRIKVSLQKSFLVVVFVATSYTFWMWATQNNTLGIAMAWQLLTGLYFYYWWKRPSALHTAIFTLFCSLLVFIHIGLVYFATGMFLTMLGRTIYLFKGEIKKGITSLGISVGILFAMAIIFILVEYVISDTSSLKELYHVLADTNYVSQTTPDERGLFTKLIEKAEHGRYNHISVYKEFYYPGWVIEQIPTGANITQMTIQKIGHISLALLGLSILIFPKTTYKKGLKPFIFSGLVTSVISIVGFALHQLPSNHYYAVVYVPNFLLFFGFIVPEGERRVEWVRQFLLLVIIAVTVYYNVFSPLNIFRGRNLDYHPYYTQSALINSHTNKRSAIFFSGLDVGYYPNAGMAEYYQNKFGHITWLSDTLTWNSREKLLFELEGPVRSDSLQVFIGPRAKDILEGDTQYIYHEIGRNIWEVRQ